MMKWTPPVRRLSAPIGMATRPATTIAASQITGIEVVPAISSGQVISGT